MIKILVTGATGQLGLCIEAAANAHPKLHFEYTSSKDLDITNHEVVQSRFKGNAYDFCINCAAYTQVDKAETEWEIAKAINGEGPKILAEICAIYGTTLIHISTDFVFNGSNSVPYTETDTTSPLGNYGASKLLGEQLIQEHMQQYFILRTSWLYSEFGHNFMKSMLRLGSERDELSIVFDQIGTPTYGRDLADAILNIITSEVKAYGLYHYSNEGVASWYDFSRVIFEYQKMTVNVSPILSEAYPTPAKRPSFSVLDKTKIKNVLKLEIPYWQHSLATALSRI